MSLISDPQGDGTAIITVDFCYYSSIRMAMRWQNYDKEGAEEHATSFAARRSEEAKTLSCEVRHEPERKRFLVIYRKRYREEG
jgi:hypothetical protein